MSDVVRIRRRGRVYEIPVDEDGKVPRWALAQRFQEAGDWEDVDSEAGVVLPADCTPEELIDWWMDPGSCDVRGIDTPDSEIYDVSSVPIEHRSAQRRIAVVDASPDEQARIRRVLSESFTLEELDAMASNGSVVIRTVPEMDGVTGCYWRRQDGVEVPLIVLEEGTTPDGIVHEMVHHSRAVDRSRKRRLRTAFPSDSEGRLRSGLFKGIPGRRKRRIVEDEERMTVAETVVRTKEDPCQSGYYDSVPRKDPRKAYEEDRRTLAGVPKDTPSEYVPRLKGRAARNAALYGYEYSNIARSMILGRSVKKRRGGTHARVRGDTARMERETWQTRSLSWTASTTN